MARVALPFGGEAWLLTRYDDVRSALTDQRLSMNAAADWDVPRVMPRPNDSSGLMGMDTANHRRLRRIVTSAFSSRRVGELRPKVEGVARSLVDDLLDSGSSGDLVAGLADPLPIRVICSVLGVPNEDRDVFRSFSEALTSTTRYTEDQVVSAMEQFTAYLMDLAEQRRAQPQDDLLSALLHDSEESQTLTENEVLMLTGGLLVGGQETTAGQLASHLHYLLAEPARFAALADDLESVDRTVEELLRTVPLWASVGPSRVATEDVEVGGVTIPAGDAVVYSLTSANHDPGAFDEPDLFDPARERRQHLAFGHGPHYCLGAPLARLELQCALREVASRMPGLRLVDVQDGVAWNEGMLVRGPTRVPVTW